MEELISVVVVTYNQEKTIGRTLDAILCQKCHLPIEIVIGEDMVPPTVHVPSVRTMPSVTRKSDSSVTNITKEWLTTTSTVCWHAKANTSPTALVMTSG